MINRILHSWSFHMKFTKLADVTILTTSVATLHFLIGEMFILKAIKSHFKGSYDKQNPTHVVMWWNLWNSPKARFINFIWNDDSCKILFLSESFGKVSDYSENLCSQKCRSRSNIHDSLDDWSLLFSGTWRKTSIVVYVKYKMLSKMEQATHKMS